jgi:pimeloyl-ACP methyl ester carboxylesterase
LSKNTKKIIKITSIVVGALLVIYLGLSAYGAKEALEIPRLPLVDVGQELVVPYLDVAFYSRGDHVLLKGWFIPGQKDEVIIILHGGFQNRVDDNVDTLDLIHDLAGKGYNVLTYDLRGRGESEGKGQALSYINEDIGGAVDYVQGRGFAIENISILGFCSGAASACIYASQNDIGKVILDGCFIDVKTMVARQAHSVGIPEFLQDIFWPGGLLFTNWLYDWQPVNPIDVVPQIKCPVFFIHEQNDEFIRLDEVQRLYQAATNPANRIWEVPSANHSQSYRTHPLEFIERVDDFLTTA